MLLPAQPSPLPLNIVEVLIPRQDDRTGTTSPPASSASSATRSTTSNTPSTTVATTSSSSSTASVSSSSPSTTSETSAISSTTSTTSSTTSSSSTPTLSESSSSGLPTSALIGIIVGSAIGFILLLLLLSVIFTAWRRRRNDRLKRPSTSVIAGGTVPSRSKRPETVYDIDSFLAPSTKQTSQRNSGVAIPLLAEESRPGSAYESNGVDEHGTVERYTDNSRPGSPASTAPPTEFSHLASPYSADGHGGDDATHYPPSLSMSHATDPAFNRLSMTPAGFSLEVAGNEQGKRTA